MITQNQNIIMYKGTKYKYIFDLTTRQADGDIQILIDREPKNVLEFLVKFYLTYPNANGFYETLIKNAYNESNCIGSCSEWHELNNKIVDIKKHYHQIQKWATEQDIKLEDPHAILDALECYHLTSMEYAFYSETGIKNKEILTKYAYQFQKYKEYLRMVNLQRKIDKIIATDGKIEKPSSILDFLLKTNQRYNEIKNLSLDQQMQKYYEKNKKYEFTDGKYNYMVPSTVEQVKNEAQMQSNCLYDLYFKLMTNNNYSNVIIYVRDINNPTKSLYTIEYRPNKKCFKQCYGKKNHIVDKSIMNYLLTQIVGRE